ncbi:MAG: winged helix-turn-helix domain-containing protein [Planctomycetota bacterium]
MLDVRWKIWVERDGNAVFGDGRARLLEGIGETGSLSAAARELGIPYRTAWKHLNAMEEGFGRKIVDRTAGGATGGGCTLTQAGRALLDAYLAFRADAEEALQARARQFLDAT